jgi:hypothetical protein
MEQLDKIERTQGAPQAKVAILGNSCIVMVMLVHRESTTKARTAE